MVPKEAVYFHTLLHAQPVPTPEPPLPLSPAPTHAPQAFLLALLTTKGTPTLPSRPDTYHLWPKTSPNLFREISYSWIQMKSRKIKKVTRIVLGAGGGETVTEYLHFSSVLL